MDITLQNLINGMRFDLSMKNMYKLEQQMVELKEATKIMNEHEIKVEQSNKDLFNELKSILTNK